MILILFFVSTHTIKGDSQSLLYEDEAKQLQAMGLFLGTDNGFELDRAPTRLEALVILIRLLGEDQKANDNIEDHPFLDVPSWGEPYVAYAYQQGLTFGLSETLFGSSQLASEAMFITFVLRALGYDDAQGDFHWTTSRDKGIEVGIIDDTVDTSVFLRDHSVGIAYRALSVPLKNQEDTLETVLIKKGAIVMAKHDVEDDLEDPLESAKVIWQGSLVGLEVNEVYNSIHADVLKEAFEQTTFILSENIAQDRSASKIEDFYDTIVNSLAIADRYTITSDSSFYLNTGVDYPTIHALLDSNKQILAYAINATIEDGYMWFETAGLLKHNESIHRTYDLHMAKIKNLTEFSANRIDYQNLLPITDEYNNKYYPIDLSDYQGQVFIVRYGLSTNRYDSYESIFTSYLMMEECKYGIYGQYLDGAYDFNSDERFMNPSVPIYYKENDYRYNLFLIIDRMLNIVGYMIVDGMK